jgi:hypothetical protein
VQNYNLVTGGWDGVDGALTEGFARGVQARGLTLQERLLQAIAPGGKPPSSPGYMVFCETDREYEAQTIARSDVVVLIAGRAYTAKAGRRALEVGVPVVPVAATGGAADEIFQEMQRSGYDTDAALQYAGLPLARATQLAIEKALRLDVALPTAARAYLRTRDLDLADLLDSRMTSWGPVPLDAAARLGEGPEHHALRACAQRLEPTREGIAGIFEALNRSAEFRQPDLNLIWLRLLAVRAAFADAGVRASLSPELETVTTSLYGRLDDETGHGGMAARLKTTLAGPLGRLMGLIKAAEAARNLKASASVVPRRNREVLDDEATASCLYDLDPGWRAVGLGRQIADPSIALLSATLGATRFESTYELHVDLCLEALGSLAKSALASEIRPEDRETIELFISRRPAGSPVNEIRAWLQGEVSAPPASGARAAAAEGWELADQWIKLIAEYDQLRETTTASPERTAAMTRVVNKMREAVLATPPDEIRAISRGWTGDHRRGWRLAGYVIAHEIGVEADITPLCQSLRKFQTPPRPLGESNDNRPFGDYWGLQALLQVLNRTPFLNPSQIAVIQQLKGIAKPGTDRADIWSQIERRVAAAGGGQKRATASTASKSVKTQRPLVFINYRRDDTGDVAARLAADLERLGVSVFMNRALLTERSSWETETREAIQRSRMFFILFGRSWLSADGTTGLRRLDHPYDFVRKEIELALSSNKSILLILVDGASFPPSSELPPRLTDLNLRQAYPLRSEDWAKGMDGIATILEAYKVLPRPAPSSPPARPPATRQARASKKAPARRPSSTAKRAARKKSGKKK